MAAATSSSASPAPVVRWEVEMDAGWGQFDTAAEAHLEETHGKGQETTTLQTNGFTYHVNFGLMTQTNAQTGRERNIRRVTVSAGSWQVELDGRQWTAYDASVQAQAPANKILPAKKASPASPWRSPRPTGTTACSWARPRSARKRGRWWPFAAR